MTKVIPFAFSLLAVAGGRGQETIRHGTVERIQVHGKALEGNLEGDSPDRKVAVYLPPSYHSAANRRYPVVYLLHGFTDEVDKWWGVKPHFVNVPVVADRALQAGVSEMMIVMPDAFTRYQGSMYSNSVTTGNWEEYITRELVAYIDSHYRTIPNATGRGLAGHSMGGYGTLRLGMKYPGIFSSLYLLSPCCLAANGVRPNPQVEKIHDPAEVANADFFTKAVFASAAAWSPNPKNPPFFFDLPYKQGEVQPQIVAKWEANAPLAMIDQYISNLRQYRSIGMDAGTQDQPIAGTVETLHRILNDYEIRHEYETYEGNHINRIAERLEKKVLPFFAAYGK
jgi:S-formylglutathione hydrolase